MKIHSFFLGVLLVTSVDMVVLAQGFKWPNGKKMAMSLTFDDARESQATKGIPLLDEYGVKGTFYLVPSNAKKQLEGWKHAVANGHEMGNHSLYHPCSGNGAWTRQRALEDYTIEQMRKELDETSRQIQEMLGVTPTSYAYPCGHTFIGRGRATQSFVPLISEMFATGRGWLDEDPVDPAYGDMAQLTGMEMDGKDFEQVLPIVKSARKDGLWLILAGHEMSTSGSFTTRLNMLRALCQYAKDPANGIWIATVAEIAAYVKAARDTINIPEMISASQNGSLLLTAEKARGIGPKIQYMPKWKAFGWFTAADQIAWEVDVPKAGNFEITMEWSVDDQEAGKAFVITGSNTSVSSKVVPSGGWESFKTKSIGRIKLAAGRQKITLKPGTDFTTGALMDLRGITLTPVK